ncbi:hypothetical protein [Pseudodesulfovibrio sediminis]|uniref:Uncharacterized protein n=1 Tax=Pseudodesulfovibrio sediminis TaxID=2810563 RepID=A0ABN6EPD2_9BACT|nr:hypothetical protein [Pseudodesulfovibrio sediminis]BCS88313.1 hypothetical protein PSDVSF_15550 [Pseudodesulfovibrio sediminis]
MSKLIEELNMNEQEQVAFDFGFVGLPIANCLDLLDITNDDFESKFQSFYQKGASYARLQSLRKLMDISDDVASLRDYMQFRANSGFNSDGDFTKALEAPDNPPMTTAEVIAELRKISD